MKRKETKTQCKEKRRVEKIDKTKKGKRKEKREERREARESFLGPQLGFFPQSWELFFIPFTRVSKHFGPQLPVKFFWFHLLEASRFSGPKSELKFLGPFYLGLQTVWPIVASQVFLVPFTQASHFSCPKWGVKFLGPPYLGLQTSLAHSCQSSFFWFHLLRPPIFLAQSRE